jgi:hypothetical protein
MAARSAASVSPFADRKPSKGGAVDGRTLVARRRRELIDVYTAALGGLAALTEGQQLDIRRAAELTALAEQARARALREGTGDAAELSAMIRLEGMAARAVRALDLPKAGGKTTEPVADLQAYLARAGGSSS